MSENMSMVMANIETNNLEYLSGTGNSKAGARGDNSKIEQNLQNTDHSGFNLAFNKQLKQANERTVSGASGLKDLESKLSGKSSAASGANFSSLNEVSNSRDNHLSKLGGGSQAKTTERSDWQGSSSSKNNLDSPAQGRTSQKSDSSSREARKDKSDSGELDKKAYNKQTQDKQSSKASEEQRAEQKAADKTNQQKQDYDEQRVRKEEDNKQTEQDRAEESVDNIEAEEGGEELVDENYTAAYQQIPRQLEQASEELEEDIESSGVEQQEEILANSNSAVEVELDETSEGNYYEEALNDSELDTSDDKYLGETAEETDLYNRVSSESGAEEVVEYNGDQIQNSSDRVGQAGSDAYMVNPDEEESFAGEASDIPAAYLDENEQSSSQELESLEESADDKQKVYNNSNERSKLSRDEQESRANSKAGAESLDNEAPQNSKEEEIQSQEPDDTGDSQQFRNYWNNGQAQAGSTATNNNSQNSAGKTDINTINSAAEERGEGEANDNGGENSEEGFSGSKNHNATKLSGDNSSSKQQAETDATSFAKKLSADSRKAATPERPDQNSRVSSYYNLNQIKVEVQKNIDSLKQGSSINIKLSPESLGDVDVKMELMDKNTLQSLKVSAEKPSTMEMLQKDSFALEESLKEVLETDNTELSFDLKQGNDSHEQRRQYENEQEKFESLQKYGENTKQVENYEVKYAAGHINNPTHGGMLSIEI
jgi:hypothetical protein